MAGKRCMRMLRTVFLMSVVALGGWSVPVPALAQETDTTLPQQPQDARRHQGERQGGAQTTLEERQRHTLPPRLQGLSPEELRVQRGAERRVLEEKARRDHQESEQQQPHGHERQHSRQQQQQPQHNSRKSWSVNVPSSNSSDRTINHPRPMACPLRHSSNRVQRPSVSLKKARSNVRNSRNLRRDSNPPSATYRRHPAARAASTVASSGQSGGKFLYTTKNHNATVFTRHGSCLT